MSTGEIAPTEITPTAPADLRWGMGASPQHRLFAEGSRFDFYQAVRLLSLLHGSSAEPVRFRSRMSFNFPGSDIEDIAPAESQSSFSEMQVNFIGLAGAHGPLPVTYTEQLLRPRNSALRDFLDIFNHRLVLLLYRVHEMHHPEVATSSPDHSLAAAHLYCFWGLGREEDSALRNRLPVPDRILLYYSGILAHRPHSANGLQQMLADYFQIDVAVEQFIGAWLDLAADQWTRIGARDGQNNALGDGALLGRRVWDEHARVMIRLGPLSLDTFERFLPGGSWYKPLCGVTRFYLGTEVDFSFKLILRADQIPASAAFGARAEASAARPAELGRLSWLESRRNGTRTANPPQDGVVVIEGDL